MLDRIIRFLGWFGIALFFGLLVGFIIYVTAVAVERNQSPVLAFLVTSSISGFIGLRFVQFERAAAARRKRSQQLISRLNEALSWSKVTATKKNFLTLQDAEAFCLRAPSITATIVLQLNSGLLLLLCTLTLSFAVFGGFLFFWGESWEHYLMFVGLALAFVLVLINAITLPKKIVADLNGVTVGDSARVDWAQIQSIRLVSLRYGLKYLEASWAKLAFAKFCLGAVRPGGVRIPLWFYRSTLASDDAIYAHLLKLQSGTLGNADIRLRLKVIEEKYERRICEWRNNPNAADRLLDEQMMCSVMKSRRIDEQDLLFDLVRRELESEVGSIGGSFRARRG